MDASRRSALTMKTEASPLGHADPPPLCRGHAARHRPGASALWPAASPYRPGVREVAGLARRDLFRCRPAGPVEPTAPARASARFDADKLHPAWRPGAGFELRLGEGP